LECLIRAGGDVNIVGSQDGQSALHNAALGSQLRIAEFLLDNGADINLTSKDGQTPLHLATYNPGVLGNFVVSLLLERGADTTLKDHGGNRPIDSAIAAKNEEVVQLLKDFESSK
jgi:ankyrin repeat protein